MTEALAAGVLGGLWALGGVPAVLRSDNLSAATHELKASEGRALTPRFRAVLERILVLAAITAKT